MKIYPAQKSKDKDELQDMTAIDMVTRRVALWVAFVSVFFFFIKLIFL